MQRDKFEQARKIYSYDPDVGKHVRLREGPINRSTVNSYCRWLRKLGVAYEVRRHHNGFYLVKSVGLSEAARKDSK